MSRTGNLSVLEIAPGGTDGTYVQISGNFSGLDNFDHAITELTRTIPGGGPQAMELVGHTEGTASFTVDDNITTRPVLWAANGKRVGVKWYRDGNAVGRPVVEFSALAEVVKTHGASDAIRYAVTLTMETEPTRSNV